MDEDRWTEQLDRHVHDFEVIARAAVTETIKDEDEKSGDIDRYIVVAEQTEGDGLTGWDRLSCPLRSPRNELWIEIRSDGV